MAIVYLDECVDNMERREKVLSCWVTKGVTGPIIGDDERGGDFFSVDLV